MATVLCAGGESLHTRHPVLKSAGFEVVTATTHDALLAAVRSPDVNAVVLDSRTSMCDLPAVAVDLKKAHPSIPVLLITDTGVEDVPQPAAAFDRVISRLDGPAVLLGTLRELTVGMVCMPDGTRRSAREIRSRSKQLRAGLSALKHEVGRLREKLAANVRTRGTR